MRLAREDEYGRINGIQVEIGDDLQFIEIFVFKKVRFIKNDYRDSFAVLYIICDSTLNSGKQLCFFIRRLCSKALAYLSIEFKIINCRQGDIEVFIEVLIEIGHKGPQVKGFPCTRQTCQKHQPPVLFHIFKSLKQLFGRLRQKDIFWVNVFWERIVFQIFKFSNFQIIISFNHRLYLPFDKNVFQRLDLRHFHED